MLSRLTERMMTKKLLCEILGHHYGLTVPPYREASNHRNSATQYETNVGKIVKMFCFFVVFLE